ncbi:hypothetical protein NDU88_004126 [Pleurodeles waltl]|uniref:Uncharacterized protein n=1 Tax=Pleurodeles waltl TaxID=8319 RepID=A0AAV7KWV6_PLEWA|nr:hypothetical protein NDU88_004126 [Pleurodeles waltl]
MGATAAVSQATTDCSASRAHLKGATGTVSQGRTDCGTESTGRYASSAHLKEHQELCLKGERTAQPEGSTGCAFRGHCGSPCDVHERVINGFRLPDSSIQTKHVPDNTITFLSILTICRRPLEDPLNFLTCNTRGGRARRATLAEKRVGVQSAILNCENTDI